MNRIFRSGWFAFAFILTGCQPKPVATPTLPVFANTVCQETYTHLYRHDSLDFRIVFGYKDARPARYVGDRYERAYFIQKILRYGFKRSLENENTFTYELVGPDRQTKKIHLQVVDSSVGPDDDANRKDAFQKIKSAETEEMFLNGLKVADLVFYYGHSRDGGGPDFAPPVLDHHQHVNYGWYLQHRPGLKKMLSALKQSNRQSNIIGLYSCVSDKLFSRELLKANPRERLLVSKVLLYYNDALEGMMETLKNILEMKCQKDFHPPGTDEVHFFKSEN